MTVDDKHYMLNRDNLTQPIQMQLSKSQKKISEICIAFLNFLLTFKHFPKKDDPHSWCISGNAGSEIYGEINISKAVFQMTLIQKTQQMDPNTVGIWMAAPLQYLLINVKVVALEKVFYSNTQNPKTIC